ncbi:Hypothetical predicted protein [Olea europaea subsp. europaea]|uniref:Uncharacterized protein n=1 Tax=Olea europaea subsp. europaea TaxID=158383 RepID=A0A8S0RCN7_OLEEU|nr:Hypothetical predicted protein [Olea europaea subsp. europaea]
MLKFSSGRWFYQPYTGNRLQRRIYRCEEDLTCLMYGSKFSHQTMLNPIASCTLTLTPSSATTACYKLCCLSSLHVRPDTQRTSVLQCPGGLYANRAKPCPQNQSRHIAIATDSRSPGCRSARLGAALRRSGAMAGRAGNDVDLGGTSTGSANHCSVSVFDSAPLLHCSQVVRKEIRVARSHIRTKHDGKEELHVKRVESYT